MTNMKTLNQVTLPGLPSKTAPIIDELTNSLNIPRTVLASSEDIEMAWINLPRELKEIPIELRDELIAKMCVAVSVGLFDGAMNYIWNASILHLRNKVRSYGLSVVSQIKRSDFEEKHLQELQDHKLLSICLELNILTESGHFLLDQCRAIRNNFSAAHPSMGQINDREFTNFLNRCVKYALADSAIPRGVDIKNFISAIKADKFTDGQLDLWVERLQSTHDAQRQMLIKMTHGIYCDPNTAEFSRLNALNLCEGLKDKFTSDINSDLINQHSNYLAEGQTDKHAASLQFFENLGLLNFLNDSEKHSIFSRSIDRLWSVHNGMNNFYNEPPFAERLSELAKQNAVPETTQKEFVEVVVCCRIGNGYGISVMAQNFYNELISGFSPREVAILINLATSHGSIIKSRIDYSSSCLQNFKTVLSLIEPDTVPRQVKAEYERFIN